MTHTDGDTDTLTRPDPTTTAAVSTGEPGDHDRFSHYVSKRQLDDAILSGATVTALCGHRWAPRRDPHRYPVCPDCKALWEGLQRGVDEVEAAGR